MSLRVHTYLSDTWNRDKVMEISQFLPMMLESPVRSLGCDSLAASLGNLSKMCDAYRAVTRLSLLFRLLAPAADSAPGENALMRPLDQLSHALNALFCMNENTAVLAGHGVVQKSLSRFGGIGVLCWLYTLLIGVARQTYLLVKHYPRKDKETSDVPYTCEEAKRAVANLVKTCCFTVFAMSCLPEGKPQLLCDVSGPFVPLHKLIQVLAPNKLQLSNTVRGMLGFVGSVCDLI